MNSKGNRELAAEIRRRGELLTPITRVSDPTIIRTYEAKRQSDAAKAFAEDAAKLAQRGYAPISQSWADGRGGCGRLLALGIFALVLKPAGSLTVTYRRANTQ